MKHQIAFCLDQGFLYPTSVALNSLLKTTESDLDIHIFGYGFKDEHRFQLSKIANNFGIGLTHHHIGSSDIALPRHQLEHISGASFLRLLLPKYLSGRVTYLDGDILVCSDITELASTNLGEKMIAATPDANGLYYNYLQSYFEEHPDKAQKYLKNKKKRRYYDKYIRSNILAETGISGYDQYFNAGIFSIDLDKLSQHTELLERFQSIKGALLEGQGRDQIYLNILFNNHSKIMDFKWNSQLQNARPIMEAIPEKERANWTEARDNPAIIHYASRRKPWHPLLNSYSFSQRHRIVKYRKAMQDIRSKFGIKYQSQH